MLESPLESFLIAAASPYSGRNDVEEIVSTWVGVAGQDHKTGERRASTNWPIQKYQWTDYMASPGDRLHFYNARIYLIHIKQ